MQNNGVENKCSEMSFDVNQYVPVDRAEMVLMG
jgi:hypothetical protein